MSAGLDIDLLRTLVTIADTGGFTRAGERLGRTQSAISLQIKRLEDSIGRPIFDRNGRRIVLTGDGELLLGYARRILRLNDEALSRIVEPELTGTVRLGTPEDFATLHLPRVLARFAESHPHVSLDVRCDLTLHLLDGFARGEFDLVLVKREPQGADGGSRVWREPLVWASSRRHAVEHQDPVNLVVAPNPCVYRKRAIQSLDAGGRRWRVAYTSPSLAGSQAAVLAGLGVTILPREALPHGMKVLGPAEGFPALPDTEIALYRAPTGLGLAAERLADHIVASLEAASSGDGLVPSEPD